MSEPTHEEFNELRTRVAVLEALVERLEQPRRTGPPSFRREVPIIPIPPDNTRTLAEIMDMLAEMRETWRRWGEEHPQP